MSREVRWSYPFAETSNENQNQPAHNHIANTQLEQADFRDLNWDSFAAGDIEGGTAKTVEEEQGTDDLIQELDWQIRSSPPTSVVPPFQSTSENQGNRPVGEEAAAAKRFKCRFCQQIFSKSQGLGGHMKRHRKERQDEEFDNAFNLLDSKARQMEQYNNRLNFVLSKGLPFQSNFHNIGSPSQIQPQFAGTSATGSWSALQAEQKPYNHIPHPFRSNPVHPQGNLYADLDALNIQNRPLVANNMNIPHGSQGLNRPDMLLTTAYNMRNQDPQPHHQPELLRSGANSGVGALSMERNYPYSFEQDMSPSSSSPVAVTQSEIFSPSLQSRHDNLRMGTSDQSGGLFAQQIERALSDHFTLPPLISHDLANQGSYFPSNVPSLQEFQNMQLLTYPSSQNPTPSMISAVNELDSMVVNVSGNLRGLTPPSQFQAATRINSQEDINVVARGCHNNSDIINSDSPQISNAYSYGSNSRRY